MQYIYAIILIDGHQHASTWIKISKWYESTFISAALNPNISEADISLWPQDQNIHMCLEEDRKCKHFPFYQLIMNFYKRRFSQYIEPSKY
jgi:hypothetical protein